MKIDKKVEIDKKVIWICLLPVLLPVFVAILVSWNLIPGMVIENDWIGFFGSYIGGIVGGIIGIASAVYVLHETQKENKRTQEKNEIIEFCDYLVKLGSSYAQKSETFFYSLVYYMNVNVNSRNGGYEKKQAYKNAIENHHMAKVVLYEILQSLNIRENVPLYLVSSYNETVTIMMDTYNQFREMERKVDEIEKEGVESMVIKDNFVRMDTALEALGKYEKDLLESVMI